MQQVDNTWLVAWNRTGALPVSRQKCLFDATKEAEKVLHHLVTMSPRDLMLQLLPSVMETVLRQLKERLERG